MAKTTDTDLYLLAIHSTLLYKKVYDFLKNDTDLNMTKWNILLSYDIQLKKIYQLRK